MGNKIIGLDLNLDQDYLEKAVHETVVVGISEALNGKNEIVSQIVKSVLSLQVDEHGNPSRNSYDKKTSLLEFYVRKELTEITKAEIAAAIEGRRKELSEMIRKEMAKASTLQRFVDAFLTNTVKTLDSEYRTKIDISFLTRDNY